MRRVQVGTFVALFLLAIVTPLVAQQGTSEIAGRITDEQGAVLPGVTIVITNEATGVFRDVVSRPEGTYFVSQLVPGRYRISAKLTGFRPVERSGLQLQVGNTLTINLALAVGGIEETVTVTAQSPLVDTTSARVGGNLGTAELSELPAMNRNYFSTVGLLPGVQFTPSNQMGNDTIIAGGQTSQNTNVSVDGGYNADDALGTSSGAQVRTPLEAVQEFQVLTSMYDAEYGRASGAIVNAVSKAGTNQFRGVVFGYSAPQRAHSGRSTSCIQQSRQADDDPARMGRGDSAAPSCRTRRTSSSASSGRWTTRTGRVCSRPGRTTTSRLPRIAPTGTR